MKCTTDWERMYKEPRKEYGRLEQELEAVKGLSNEWVRVEDSKPSQGDRVLLKTKYDDKCPYIVGYWGCGTWEACTVNVEADKDYNGNQACVERAFSNDDVTHWQPLPLPPKENEE